MKKEIDEIKRLIRGNDDKEKDSNDDGEGDNNDKEEENNQQWLQRQTRQLRLKVNRKQS